MYDIFKSLGFGLGLKNFANFWRNLVSKSLVSDKIWYPIGQNLVISTEGALMLPTTYDNHPSNPSTYSCEDDLSIEDLI